MNNIFSFRRFTKLFIKELVERKSIYLYTALGMLIIPPFLYFIIPLGPSSTVVAFVALCAPFIMYSNVNHKKQAAGYIMLPVSPLEKMISLLLHTSVILPVILWLCLKIVALYAGSISPLFATKATLVKEIEYLSIDLIWSCILMYHPLLIIGIFAFKNFQFVKTMLVFWPSLLAFIYAMALIYFALAQGSDAPISFRTCIFTSMKAFPRPIVDQGLISHVLSSVIISVSLLVTFFKIKEQEV